MTDSPLQSMAAAALQPAIVADLNSLRFFQELIPQGFGGGWDGVSRWGKIHERLLNHPEMNLPTLPHGCARPPSPTPRRVTLWLLLKASLGLVCLRES